MKGINIILIILFSILLLSACGSSSEDGTDKNENGKSTSDDERWEEINTDGEIVVGTSGTLFPASYYEGDTLTGFDVEVMRELAKRLNLDITFETMGVDSMLSAIQSGRIDVAANQIESTEKRKKEFNFSEPYKYSYTTMVVRKDDNSEINSLEDLQGKKAGGGATTVYSQIAEHFGAEVVTYGNAPNEAYLRDVHNGRTDVVINDYYLQKFGIAEFPEFDIHLHPELRFRTTEQSIVIPKGETQLTTEINQVLKEMRNDGTLSDLAIQYFEEDASKKPNLEMEEIEGLDL
ncbi:transporter substrate-binding domain-containing protein [Oceanobacillus kimchii]|uniref:transporter substrate-binding domain-containing protein n=1 Tax=Oceanobacillus TaxID=182709 RepID=UPI00084EB338|nr:MULTISPECIES: transporter substrate-binding domain-containing protein [Oceanobacillus]MCT1578237.1 transporter substrate-binding domain-containing protein [Oceanobacillus kimchii]MCT2134415.1 transporter substrate-binding domain-containing protein [Oceanobacillus kimchii]OEH54957.1 amino acid ABC transporter substrate-binding protein [Oceanobacillus sp. E9]